MLNIYLGDYKDVIYTPGIYFDNTYDEKWFESDIVKQMVLDIDKSKVVNGHCIESPVLGMIPTERLSGGVKTLILMLFNDTEVFNASACGDNCVDWIIKIGEMKDITINLRHHMDFTGKTFTARIVNDGTIVHNSKELLHSTLEYL